MSLEILDEPQLVLFSLHLIILAGFFFFFLLTHLYSVFALPQISGVDFAGLKGHTQGACLGPPWDEGTVFRRPFPVSLNVFPPSGHFVNKAVL